VTRYKVIFWQTDKGEKPVAQWLNALPVKDQEYLGNIFFDLAHDGPLSRPKVFKHLDGQLWEIKDKRSPGPGYRIYFGFDGDVICLVLHAGDKGTQDRDIKLAQKRLDGVSWKK
jgi:putative addiction module killer protein